MIRSRIRRFAALAALPLALLAGCGDDAAPPGAAGRGVASASAPRPLYVREYVFLATHGGEPLVAPIRFESSHRGQQTEREATAWLARGSTWDAFLDEAWQTAGRSDVWRILPHGPLRIAARGPLDPAALWFREGERRLRLDLGSAVSGWNQQEDTRFRVLRGRLRLGEESIAGVVLEILQIVRFAPDGTGPGAADWLFLASGDSLGLVLAELGARGQSPGRGFGWTVRGEGERAWDAAEIGYLELRPLEPARRDIPLRWSFSLPEAGITGEVRALGYDTQLGPERAARRAVEARYTVEGWMQDEGRRVPLLGAVRHAQR